MANQILDINRYNQDLREWGNRVKRKMQTEVAGHSLRTQLKYLEAARNRDGRKALQRSINARFFREGGEINAVRFVFSRHGVFVERGIAGKATYEGRPWITPVIEQEFPHLEKLILEHYDKGLRGQLRLLVPGVVDKTANFGK